MAANGGEGIAQRQRIVAGGNAQCSLRKRMVRSSGLKLNGYREAIGRLPRVGDVVSQLGPDNRRGRERRTGRLIEC